MSFQLKLKILKEKMLELLTIISSVTERKSTMPILTHVKILVETNQITLLGSDSQVELIAQAALGDGCCVEAGETTIPAKKLLDIFKALPANSMVNIATSSDERCKITANKSKFSLGTLPACDFPVFNKNQLSDNSRHLLKLELPQYEIKRIFEKTAFAMAVQDVRFYLTGTHLDYESGILRAVTTDGHRLAYCEATVKADSEDKHVAIVPKKGISELLRLTTYTEDVIELKLSSELIQLKNSIESKDSGLINIELTIRLIEGKFPDYQRVIPVGNSKVVQIATQDFKQTLQRASILSNEKIRGLTLSFDENLITISAKNTDQDEAIESLDVQYNDSPMTISFNGTYLTDAIACINDENLLIEMSEENKSVLVKSTNDPTYFYVVMPIRN